MMLLKVCSVFFCFALANGLHVINFDLMKCSSHYSPVSFENVFVDFGENKELLLSGTMRTDINLTAPLAVKVELKKHIGFWIPVPCDNNKGSCTYPDICKCGYPVDKDCPQKFIDNKIPCRCPLAKGEYTLPKLTVEKKTYGSVYTGKYKGTVTLTLSGDQLACYNTQFEVVDNSKTRNWF